MSKEIEPDFVEKYNPIDDIESSHSELQRSTNYANSELYSLDQLKVIAEKWNEEAINPLRSERSRTVCQTIARRATFECAAILGNVELMAECYRSMYEEAA